MKSLRSFPLAILAIALFATALPARAQYLIGRFKVVDQPGTIMTFPSTSATLARSDAAQVFASSVTSASPTAGIGYATGAGGAVTQATNRTTGVTLSKVSGAITTNNASLAAGASASFTVTNTAVAIGDVVVVSIRSGATNKETRVAVTTVAAGSFEVTVHNLHATVAETGAIIVNFAVLKAVSS